MSTEPKNSPPEKNMDAALFVMALYVVVLYVVVIITLLILGKVERDVTKLKRSVEQLEKRK
jgi:hypothetical protein